MRSSGMRLYCLALVLAVVAPAQAQKPVPAPPFTLAPLTWDMDVAHVTQALEAARLSPRYAETHRYLATTPDRPYPEHTSEPTVLWVPRAGWFGAAHFMWDQQVKADRLDRMSETATSLTPATLRVELGAVLDRYGDPSTVRANVWAWHRGGTRMTARWSTDETKQLSSLEIAIVPDSSLAAK